MFICTLLLVHWNAQELAIVKSKLETVVRQNKCMPNWGLQRNNILWNQ